MTPSETLLAELLRKQCYIAIECGRLVVHAPDGRNPSKKWLTKNRDQLVREISIATQVEVFEYLYYTTGKYSESRYSGITLQLQQVTDLTSRHAIFNAILDRARTTIYGEKGAPLKGGRFRLRKGSKFIKFWRSASLKMPTRLSAFSDCMGKLKQIYFTGTANRKGKIVDLSPLEISFDELKHHNTAINRLSNPTIGSQISNNNLTTFSDKKSGKNQQPRGLGPSEGTGNKNHGYKSTGVRGSSLTDTDLSTQSNAEWINDYMKADT